MSSSSSAHADMPATVSSCTGGDHRLCACTAGRLFSIADVAPLGVLRSCDHRRRYKSVIYETQTHKLYVADGQAADANRSYRLSVCKIRDRDDPALEQTGPHAVTLASSDDGPTALRAMRGVTFVLLQPLSPGARYGGSAGTPALDTAVEYQQPNCNTMCGRHASLAGSSIRHAEGGTQRSMRDQSLHEVSLQLAGRRRGLPRAMSRAMARPRPSWGRPSPEAALHSSCSASSGDSRSSGEPRSVRCNTTPLT